MIILIVMGVVLALVVAPNFDMTISTLRGMGYDAGAGTDWDTTNEFWFVHNILVLMMYSPGPLGVIIFLISVTKRQRRDSYAEAGALYYGEE